MSESGFLYKKAHQKEKKKKINNKNSKNRKGARMQ